MTREAAPIDISTKPELARIVRELTEDGRPRVLREADKDVAVISPLRPKRHRRGKQVTQADIEAVLSVVGSWTDLEYAERLKRELDEARSDNSAPVDL
jgi:hypothetical protein